MTMRTLVITSLLTASTALAGCADPDDTSGLDDVAEGSTGEDSDGSEGSGESDDADDSSDGADDESGGMDPFADCERGVIEDDLVVVDAMGVPGAPRWFGPGADPETGALLDDGTTTYHVSATYLTIQPTAEAQEAFFSVLPGTNEALFSNPGLVAVQLASSESCATARTFTVWSDEAAMMEFVISDGHMQAAARIGAISRGGSVVTSWPDALASEIDWDSALEHLADTEPLY